ncbi:MAG: M20/M25/M40 family metallo-hydrolase [Propionibacteriaceae bacterium]|jgi:acetylornithine deacetylase/succinyl-diaminopimelate desuccinylase-like protein|nr:M20/M25/M40 family metallo-hydrolase [Propionibacteriaceae bacterium]
MADLTDTVVGLTSDLIRIDSSNFGPTTDGPGERVAAEYIATQLEAVGIESTLYEAAPGRTTLVARWEPAGVDRSRPPLLIHGHTDVVPAVAADWSVDPFAGAVIDDYVWGRGAVDMKNFDAMVLAVVQQRQREGRPPARPIRLVFTADEEAGSRFGASWLVRHHPDEVSDCTEAIGEVGGFSLTLGGRRLYLIETAEKGLAWLKLVAEGTAGHGSMRQNDNAVVTLAEAIARVGHYRFPRHLHPAQQAFLEAAGEALGVDLMADSTEATLRQLGGLARMIAATMSHTVNPTVLAAGYKVNVVPGQASAELDGRFLPGQRDEFIDTIRDLIGPKVSLEILHEQPSIEADMTSDLVTAMTAALRRHDPEAQTVPYLLSAGTDGKAWSQLGIQCYGFTPLQLPPELDFSALFHGVDERVPVSALTFGCRVLDDFLDLA